MEMPSETPMVLKRIPTRPASTTPRFTTAAKSLRCMLQLLPSYQTAEMPTSALSRSARLRPVACSIACEAPCEAGWVIRLLYLLIFLLMGAEESSTAKPRIRQRDR